MKKVLALAIILAILFSGCNKSDGEEETKKSRNELLVGTWIITDFVASPAIDYDGDGDTETQIYDMQLSCEKDNLLIFEAGGVLKLDEGPTKCSVTDGQLDVGEWELANNGDILVLNIDDSFSILQLDRTTMKLLYSDKDDNDNEITFTYTFRRQ